MRHKVWIISEGSPGHVSQSEGLVAALAKKIPLEAVTIQTRLRFPGFIRPLIRFWMGRDGMPLADKFLARWADCKIPSNLIRPDLIITSGGKAVFAARSLAAKYAVPLVFIGERKPYHSQWFHTVFTPSVLENSQNDISIELIPTHITQERVELAVSNWTDRPTGKLWTLVIGGTSSSHLYDKSDWEELAKAMILLAQSENLRWLITTSRRTGSEAEFWLRSALDPNVVASAVWWSQKPEKKMACYLGAAECVFVTQDSVTMVTEAVASRRPVVVIHPAVTLFNKKSFLPAYLQNLHNRKRITRLSIRDLNQFIFNSASFELVNTSIENEIASQLLNRLNLLNTPKA